MQQILLSAKPDIRHGGGGEHSLIADVVYRQHRARALEQLIPAIYVFEQQRPESGVPVMAVQDIGAEAEMLAHLERRTGQSEEAQMLIV
jgi:hypothetical protein